MRLRHQVHLNIVGVVGLLLLTILSLSGCTKEEPLKIGFVGGLSGRVADLGIAGRNGTILAVEERNAQRGVRGREIELLTEDDRQAPEVARAAVTRLIDQNVAAIVGHMTSAMSTVTVPIVNERKVTMVSPTTTTERLSGLDDYFFRVIDSTRHYASHGARHMRTERQVKKIAAIYDLNNEAFTASYLDDFRTTFEDLDGEVVKTQPYRSGDEVSFLTLVETVVTPETEGVLIIASALDAALLCQQIHKLKRNLQIITSEWSGTEKFINLGGSAVEGVLVHQYFDRDSKDKKYLAFRDAYIARFGNEPGFASVGGYDAANVVLDALEQQAVGKSLKETILSIATFTGVQGYISFNRFGDTFRETHLSIVKGGKFVALD